MKAMQVHGLTHQLRIQYLKDMRLVVPYPFHYTANCSLTISNVKNELLIRTVLIKEMITKRYDHFV
jgi:hypothetical protein